MRTYDNFPAKSTCPVCGTNDNRECVLVPIVGAEEGGNVECKPFHADCVILVASRWMAWSEE